MLDLLFQQGWGLNAPAMVARSDMFLGAVYLAVPIGLASLVRQRSDLRFGWVFWLFTLFAVACGTTHVMDALVWRHPDPAILAVVKALSAALSAVMITVLWARLPALQALPTSAQYRDVLSQLSDETSRHVGTAERLRRAEESFRLLAENVHDYAIFVLDPSGWVISWNAGAERIKQYTAGEIIGRHFSCFYSAADQNAGKPVRALETALRVGSYQEEGPRIRKDGSCFLADVVINPIRDKDGHLIGFAKITRDITQRRENEQEMDRIRAALAQSQKMEAVGQLTGGIAHDFNNLLAVILGSLELMELRQETFSARAAKTLEVIRHAVDHGAELTRRLLTFSRKQALTPTVTDVNKLVSGVTELLRRTLGQGVAVKTTMAGGLWPAFVDANQVESALLNLAVNARDAMPQGGRLTIETDNVVLERDATRRNGDIPAGEYVCIAVSDTGSGMTGDVQERAFEPFYTTKAAGRGTGLGLSQVYGFVRQSGGHVALDSEVGRGTTVTLYFPRSGADVPATDDRKAAANAWPSGTETILVVESDEDVRSFSVNAARHLGYTVLEAADSASAIEMLDARRDVSLLLADVGLRGIGQDLADHVRATRPEVKIVFTSGSARKPGGNLDLLERGVLFLSKPFRIERLAQVLRQALDAHPE